MTANQRMWEIRLGWILVWEDFGLNIFGQITFFDITVFNQNVNRYKGKTIQQCYTANEMEKKQKSNECILQAENGSFTLLVFSVNGGLGNEANKCYSRIAKKLVEKRDKPYSVMTSPFRWWNQSLYVFVKVTQLSMSEKTITSRN